MEVLFLTFPVPASETPLHIWRISYIIISWQEVESAFCKEPGNASVLLSQNLLQLGPWSRSTFDNQMHPSGTLKRKLRHQKAETSKNLFWQWGQLQQDNISKCHRDSAAASDSICCPVLVPSMVPAAMFLFTESSIGILTRPVLWYDLAIVPACLAQALTPVLCPSRDSMNF